jgi:hypothetical protein
MHARVRAKEKAMTEIKDDPQTDARALADCFRRTIATCRGEADRLGQRIAEMEISRRALLGFAAELSPRLAAVERELASAGATRADEQRA